MANPRREVVAELVKTADLYNESLGESKIQVWLEALDGLDSEKVCRAFQELRRTQPYMPRPGHVRGLVEGDPAGFGEHLGPEAAWALVGHTTEDDTVVWTDEIAGAFGAVRLLLEEDHVAARMAFLEIYREKLAQARLTRMPARWSASVGTDPTRRAGPLTAAVAAGRLSMAAVQSMLPAHEWPQQWRALPEHAEAPRETENLVRDLAARLALPGEPPVEPGEAKQRARALAAQLEAPPAAPRSDLGEAERAAAFWRDVEAHRRGQGTGEGPIVAPEPPSGAPGGDLR